MLHQAIAVEQARADDIARLTDYPAFDIVVAVSASDPADRRQARIMRRVGALPRVRGQQPC
jgi:hypothetical protein